VVFLDLRHRRRSKKETIKITAKANNVQPTPMPAAMPLDNECEVVDVDDAGNADGLCDVDVDEALLELVEVCPAAGPGDVRPDDVEGEA
jgi:hypothetical protein